MEWHLYQPVIDPVFFKNVIAQFIDDFPVWCRWSSSTIMGIMAKPLFGPDLFNAAGNILACSGPTGNQEREFLHFPECN